MNNRLLNIEEIIDILDRDFIPMESIVSGLRLKKHVEEKKNVEYVERRMGMEFPDDFVNLILNYDFGDFSILGVHFGSKTNYLENLITIHENLSNEDVTYLADKFICIAIGDYYTFIMEVSSGNIYIYGSETPFNKKIKIAESFTELIQALGTAYFHMTEGTQMKFLDIVKQTFDSNSMDFWKEVIN